MALKKILTFEKLTEYDQLIKGLMSENLSKILAFAKQHTNDAIAKITDGTTTVAKATHAASAESSSTSSDASKLGGKLPSYYAKASDIPTGSLANKSFVSESDLDSTLAGKVNAASQGNHSHSNKSVLDGITSEKVSKWESAETNAKSYTDEKIALIMENPTEAVDSVYELRDAMNNNGDAIEALREVAGSKVPTSRKVNGKTLTSDVEIGISDIPNLETVLSNASGAISANTSSITGHSGRISSLEGKIGDGFEEITSAEVQSLFP